MTNETVGEYEARIAATNASIEVSVAKASGGGWNYTARQGLRLVASGWAAGNRRDAVTSAQREAVETLARWAAAKVVVR
jgi:hypothetical protein